MSFRCVRSHVTPPSALIVLLTLGIAEPAFAQALPKPTGARPSKQYTIEQFMATTNVSGASFSPDESRILFSSNKTDIYNAYTVPIAGGDWTPITKSTTDTTFAVSYFPKDERILATRDQGGNEQNHLYVIQRDGTERDLTPGPKLKASFGGWAHDGSAFYVLTNERDARFFDVYRMDAATYERRLVYKDETGYQLGSISNDGKWLAFAKPTTTADSDIYLWNTDKGEMKHITPHQGDVNHFPADFDAEGKALYYITDAGREFAYVRRYDLAAGRHEDVERADWDISYTYFSHNGKYRVTGVNEDGRTRIKLYDVASGREMPLPTMPDGVISSVSIARSERRMAFYVNGDRSPNNLYVLTFGETSARRLTDTLSPEIDANDLVDSEIIRFKSFDGLQIPAIFYKPHQASAARKAPALVSVHGGPGGQSTKGYRALIQYLVNHGYVVLDINNRGSSGYGKTFYNADDGKHGKEPLWDCVEAKKYLASLPYVDGSRVGIMGGSYGGYMVLAALAFQPDVFAVGVDLFGISNWVRTLESIPPYWEAFRKALYKEIGDPSTEREKLLAVSPLFHAKNIRKPLMVLQGANDPRVIKPESDDIVAAVKQNGVPVEYVIFADEGHGFTKKKNQIEGYRGLLQFLDRYLKGTQTSSAPF